MYHVSDWNAGILNVRYKTLLHFSFKQRKVKLKKNEISFPLSVFPFWELLLCSSREILESTQQMAPIAFPQFPPKPRAHKCLYVCGSVYTWVKHGEWRAGKRWQHNPRETVTRGLRLWSAPHPPECLSSAPPAFVRASICPSHSLKPRPIRHNCFNNR